jgi:hypothetical protein
VSELAIDILGTESSYRPGETIRGEVVVRVSEPTDCRGLLIATEYRTEGAVNEFRSEPRPQKLFAGSWPSGEHRYPFELTAPPGPATYRGRLFTVRHFLVARADLALARDPVAECPFDVAAEDVRDYDDGPGWIGGMPSSSGSTPIDPHARPRGIIVPAGLALFTLFGLFFFVVASLALWYEPGLETVLVFPVGLGFFLAPLYGAYKMYWGWFAGRSLGRPDVVVERRVIRAGDSTSVRIRYRAQRRLALTRAEVHVECSERTFTGHGKHRNAYDETLHSEKLPLDVPDRVAAGETIDRVIQVAVPRDAAPSFGAGDAGVVWSVGLHLAAGRGRFVSRVVPLTVRPPAPTAG